ncbi:MAG: hypothetical protein ACRCTZ_14620, partial [Sarcina sp.]
MKRINIDKLPEWIKEDFEAIKGQLDKSKFTSNSDKHVNRYAAKTKQTAKANPTPVTASPSDSVIAIEPSTTTIKHRKERSTIYPKENREPRFPRKNKNVTASNTITQDDVVKRKKGRPRKVKVTFANEPEQAPIFNQPISPSVLPSPIVAPKTTKSKGNKKQLTSPQPASDNQVLNDNKTIRLYLDDNKTKFVDIQVE